jgi:hypothetical protein
MTPPQHHGALRTAKGEKLNRRIFCTSRFWLATEQLRSFQPLAAQFDGISVPGKARLSAAFGFCESPVQTDICDRLVVYLSLSAYLREMVGEEERACRRC